MSITFVTLCLRYFLQIHSKAKTPRDRTGQRGSLCAKSYGVGWVLSYLLRPRSFLAAQIAPLPMAPTIKALIAADRRSITLCSSQILPVRAPVISSNTSSAALKSQPPFDRNPEVQPIVIGLTLE
jgi:hypothetical protein